MNRILVVCMATLAMVLTAASFVGTTPSADTVAAASSSFAGTWKGAMNDLPGIDLTIREAGGKISSSVVFYFQKRADVNSPWHATADPALPLLNPHVNGRILTFEVEHHVCDGCKELGPNATFRMEIAGANEARLTRFGEDGTEAGTQVKLVRGNGPASQHGTGSWSDASPHKIQFVTVDDGAQLEVLDWGGTGRPIVLLAGYQTAHVFDDFAPRLTQIGHIYGITRRGFGASSRPESGYTSQRRSEDVRCVLDALELSKPILVGHSFGGQDMTILAENHPERIAALVYLNSAENPTVTDYGVSPPDPEKLPAKARHQPHPDLSSFQAYRAWQMQTQGIAFPEPEVRQLYAANEDGTIKYSVSPKVREAMFHGLEAPDFARIKVPVLAFFVAPITLDDYVRKYEPRNHDERAAVEQQYRFEMAVRDRHIQDLRKGVPSAHVVELSNANYYIFLSNEADVSLELRNFVDEYDSAHPGAVVPPNGIAVETGGCHCVARAKLSL
jgi:non-heme chloroperoxidase